MKHCELTIKNEIRELAQLVEIWSQDPIDNGGRMVRYYQEALMEHETLLKFIRKPENVKKINKQGRLFPEQNED